MNHSSEKDYGTREPGWTCEDEIDSLRAEVARRPTALQLNDMEDQRDAAETMLKEAELERDEHAKHRADAEACCDSLRARLLEYQEVVHLLANAYEYGGTVHVTGGGFGIITKAIQLAREDE